MMHAASSTLANGVDAWLDRATGGLCAEAAARVRREVVEHCVASQEAKLAVGMAGEDADRAVVAELGSWRAARRRFRRTHLTKGDVWRLAWFTGQPVEGARHPRMYVGAMWIGAFLFLLMSLSNSFQAASLEFAINQWSMALLWISIGTRIALGPIARWRKLAFDIKHLVMLSALLGSAYFAAIGGLAFVNLVAITGTEIEPWSDTFWHLIGPVFYALGALVPALLDWRLVRKLPSHPRKGAA